MTHCEAVLAYKAEGACLLLCQPLLYSFSFQSHGIFAQPGCYLPVLFLHGSPSWKCSMGVG